MSHSTTSLASSSLTMKKGDVITTNHDFVRYIIGTCRLRKSEIYCVFSSFDCSIFVSFPSDITDLTIRFQNIKYICNFHISRDVERNSVVFKINKPMKKFSADFEFIRFDLQRLIVPNKEIHLFILDESNFDISSEGNVYLGNFIDKRLTQNLNEGLHIAKAAYNARVGSILNRFFLDLIRGVNNRNSTRVIVVRIFNGLGELIESGADNIYSFGFQAKVYWGKDSDMLADNSVLNKCFLLFLLQDYFLAASLVRPT